MKKLVCTLLLLFVLLVSTAIADTATEVAKGYEESTLGTWRAVYPADNAGGTITITTAGDEDAGEYHYFVTGSGDGRGYLCCTYLYKYSTEIYTEVGEIFMSADGSIMTVYDHNKKELLVFTRDD